MGQSVPNNAITVLVTEDDNDVREIVVLRLEAEGFTVLQAASGHDAMTILSSGTPIDVLFTDIVMPGDIDGFDLAGQAKQLRPDLRVIYTSGYTRNVPFGSGVSHGPFLQKPYKQDDLVAEIKRASPSGRNSP